MAKVGYIRVSTARQNTGRQEVAMPEDVRKLFIDHQSGKDADRPNLKACFDFLREGDTLIVESISRFARNTRDLLAVSYTHLDVYKRQGYCRRDPNRRSAGDPRKARRGGDTRRLSH